MLFMMTVKTIGISGHRLNVHVVGVVAHYVNHSGFARSGGAMTEYSHVSDSGARESFPTGSVRDTRAGKGRYDLLPPISIHRIAQHFENGSRKYGDRNWELGQHLSRYMDSALRHLFRFLGGERDEDHLAAAAWNVMALIHTEDMIRQGKLPMELNDMPNVEEPINGKRLS